MIVPQMRGQGSEGVDRKDGKLCVLVASTNKQREHAKPQIPTLTPPT